MSTCKNHPDRAARARGLCGSCYKRETKKPAAKKPPGSYRGPRARTLKSRGWTLEKYRAQFDVQAGLCAVCGMPGGAKALAADHDHGTGRPRELLCLSCNVVLGHVRDSAQHLLALAAYLKKHGGDVG